MLAYRNHSFFQDRCECVEFVCMYVFVLCCPLPYIHLCLCVRVPWNYKVDCILSNLVHVTRKEVT